MNNNKAEALQENVQEVKKGFSLFRLACKQIKTYLWMNTKLCLTFAALAFLFCLFTVYNVAIEEYRDNKYDEIASSNYIIFQSPSQDEIVHTYYSDFVYEDHYLLHNYAPTVSAEYAVGGQYNANSTYFFIDVDGKEYIPLKNVTFATIACETGYFTEFDYRELKARYGYDSFFSAGHYPEALDEIAVSELLLDAYKMEPEDVLDKTMTVKFRKKTEGEFVEQFTMKVCGIYRRELTSLKGHSAEMVCRPTFLFPYGSDFFKSSYYHRYRRYLADWPELEDVLSWQYTDSSTKYVGKEMAAHISNTSKVQILAANLYAVVGTTLAIGLILTVFLMIDKYIKVFSRSGGILMTFGLKRSQMFALLAIQLLLLCLAAIPIAAILTLLGYTVLSALLKWVVAISLTVSAGEIATILIVAVAIVFAIAAMFFLVSLIRLRRKPIKEILHTEVD